MCKRFDDIGLQGIFKISCHSCLLTVTSLTWPPFYYNQCFFFALVKCPFILSQKTLLIWPATPLIPSMATFWNPNMYDPLYFILFIMWLLKPATCMFMILWLQFVWTVWISSNFLKLYLHFECLPEKEQFFRSAIVGYLLRRHFWAYPGNTAIPLIGQIFMAFWWPLPIIGFPVLHR